jgi:hypothetical protein
MAAAVRPDVRAPRPVCPPRGAAVRPAGMQQDDARQGMSCRVGLDSVRRLSQEGWNGRF